MTKSDLIGALAVKKNLQMNVADRIINEIFDYMSDTLVTDGRIEIRGFGSFENRQYGGRSGRNPKTGELVTVEEKKRPFFKVGLDLKKRLNGGQ
jgi:integration host factor subunit beta